MATASDRWFVRLDTVNSGGFVGQRGNFGSIVGRV